jgi:16S rRNA (adenine1518-N6/adenine1519-N6)-dimethyltransferase
LKNRTQTNHIPAAVHHKHDLGQHFLYDANLLRSLVDKTGLTSADRVLEIGAGAGTLTRVLCETAASVTTVEVDKALIPRLLELAAEFPNLTVIERDIRKLDLRELFPGEGFKVVANIPYSITAQILDLFWGKGLPVSRISVMVQKEVAEKLTATPGDKAYGLISVRCRYYCEPEIAEQVPASAFTPPPKVDSAFVNLTFRTAPPVPVLDEPLLWRLVRESYNLRRKTLLNGLKNTVPLPAEVLREILANMSVSQTVRGEELSVEQWIALANAIRISLSPSPASESC